MAPIATGRPGAEAVADGDAGAGEVAVTGAAVAGSRGVLLLVEDEDVVRRIAERTLARRGWHVIAAASGEGALDMLANGSPPPSVLVTDMALPGMDGAEVIRAVRARLGQPALRAVLASGFARETIAIDLAAESVRFLSKPFLPAELVERVEGAATGAGEPIAELGGDRPDPTFS